MAGALHIAAEEGVDPNSLGLTFNAAGDPVFTKVPSWQTLDYIKRGIDDVVEANRDKTTGKLVLDTLGRATDSTRTQYRNALKALNPSYRAALDTFSDGSASIDAVNRGRKIFTTKPEQTRAFVANMSKSDQEFFRLGAADALLEKIAKTSVGGDDSKRLVGNSYVQDQLAPLFPRKSDFNKFIASVEAEAKMFKIRHSVIGGSDTARRVAEDGSPMKDAALSGAKAALHAAHGNLVSSGRHVFNSMQSLADRRTPEVNAEVARLLTQPIAGRQGENMLRALASATPKLATSSAGITCAFPTTLVPSLAALRRRRWLRRYSRRVVPRARTITTPPPSSMVSSGFNVKPQRWSSQPHSRPGFT
jgi:hypothetical protein